MNKDEIIAKGKYVIDTELSGIEKLRNSLGDEFFNVCNLLFNNKGRVVLTGMGKSGHIAKKIVATFSSTGTPSFFVHPAEATHGDMGMIQKNDVVIGISNSGNTIELQGILNYVGRYDIPLIAITANPKSELGKASTYCLLLPDAREACSLGLAPTTSTTNMLVLGDAIAITLLEMRGFSADDFNVFHPGGSLGAKMIKISNIMHTDNEIPLVLYGTTMDNAIINITSHKFGCVGVVNDQGVLIGIITDGDIRRAMSENFLSRKVENIMNTHFHSITEEASANKVLLLMETNKITNLFVVKEGIPVGIVHIHDLLKMGVV